jgi:O-antigen/teichoic acid export membrane protein
LQEEVIPGSETDSAEACASVPPPSGFWAICMSLLRGKITGAAVALVIRQAVVMALSVGSSVAVSRWLGPEVVGRFAILIFISQGILGYFGDLGLKAALIRKRGNLDPTELSTANTIVFVVSSIFAVGITAALPLILPLVKLGPENFVPAMIFAVLLVVRNQRMVPLAILERSMRFKIVSAVEAGESLTYTLVLGTMAILHRGIWSYVLAMSCRDVVGSVAFNLIAHAPWRKFSWKSIRPHVSFSLVYQGASLLNMLTLAFPPIVIARMLGKNSVGYVSWASTLSLYPLVICNAMTRIYLPAFSSAAHDAGLLRVRVEKSLRINASVAWPACAVLASLSTPIIAIIFTPKWFPAQDLLYAYCVNAILTAVGLPLTELFFSQNDAWFNFWLCALWTVPTWTVGTYSVAHYGLFGFAFFQAALQSTWFLAFVHARSLKGLRVFAPLREPLALSIFLLVGNLALCRVIRVNSLYTLIGILAVEAVICGAFLIRMLLSWRAEGGGVLSEPNPAPAN